MSVDKCPFLLMKEINSHFFQPDKNLLSLLLDNAS